MSSQVLVVSSDPQMGQHLMQLLAEGQIRSTVLFKSGAECLAALEAIPDDTSLAVLVDGALSDVSPLNLAGAIGVRRPDAAVVFSVTPVNDAIVERAMLAGARAVLDRSRVDVDLVPVVQRVTVTSSKRQGGITVRSAESKQGLSVVFTGARGGAGRTTLSTCVAWSAARRGLDCALVDFDLQFGDLSFVLGVTPQNTLVDMVRDISSGGNEPQNYGTIVRDGLTLYAPSPQPEQAELVAPRVAQVMRRLQEVHDLVIVNTGAFWTLFHAELLDSADTCALVLDQRASAIKATVQAKGLCQKLGVPDARMVFVMNRVATRGGVSPVEAAAALRIPEVMSVPEGGADVSAFMDAGDVEGLFLSKNSLPSACDRLLTQLCQMKGLKLPPQTPSARSRGLLRGRA